MQLMRLLANNSVNFFKVTVFDAQGWISGGTNRWVDRKKPDPGRKLLVKTGIGRQSIQIQKIGLDYAIIEAAAPYMKYHNEGTKNIPQRKFMGESATLNRANNMIIKKFM